MTLPRIYYALVWHFMVLPRGVGWVLASERAMLI